MASNTVSDFESLLQKAQKHRETAEWELVLRELQEAERLSRAPGFPDADRRRQDLLGELGAVERRIGRYEDAVMHLQAALEARNMEDMQRVTVIGELATVYRQMGLIEKARYHFHEQYNLANKLAIIAEAQSCRAIGNLGMANYQIAVQNTSRIDTSLLHEAIDQLERRVESARELHVKLQRDDPQSPWVPMAKTWESIGLDRLTLCHAADGNTAEAVSCGERSREMTKGSPDPTVRALSRFFYGYALLRNGQREAAMEQWEYSDANDRCTSAIALCKEPSDEHRDYLRVLVREGVSLAPYDEQGYSALDYSVYSNDGQTEAVVVAGLQKFHTFEEIEELRKEANLRKNYREIFQHRFRPELSNDSDDCIDNLKRVYKTALEVDEAQRRSFDGLRYMRYTDFAKNGRLPRSTDGLLIDYADRDAEGEGQYVIFCSYRWIGRESDPSIDGPDDAHNTQYKRMIDAIDGFLIKHEALSRENVNIWLDCACIDQENLTPGRRERGISALPLIVAQCNAMISLVDDKYFDRAWCAVEVAIMQTLRTSYSVHECWEHRLHRPEKDRIEGYLQRSRRTFHIDDNVTSLHLTYENDRPKVAFLVRQSKLLGRSQS